MWLWECLTTYRILFCCYIGIDIQANLCQLHRIEVNWLTVLTFIMRLYSLSNINMRRQQKRNINCHKLPPMTCFPYNGYGDGGGDGDDKRSGYLR